ncbi:hypothetical protein [Microvirga sp. VF16]|uniref:hypothetical protein n=1 Tax=Microvirga sp. VF16 TaxID=2807101 RepID=UPI00193D2BA9|nr:hypothetical protein [Microvirga sp. VF16]QRM32348.1 hypothetical protein JO965_29990 [Microvirga sp. VF16]
MFLLDDRVVRRSSPISPLLQKAVEIGERVHRHLAEARLHLGAGDRIEHPGRHHQHDARLYFNLHEASGDTVLRAAEENTPPIQRMPATMDDHFLPDMGRMTRRLRSGAGTGPLLARIAAGIGRQRCTC